MIFTFQRFCRQGRTVLRCLRSTTAEGGAPKFWSTKIALDSFDAEKRSKICTRMKSYYQLQMTFERTLFCLCSLLS